MNYWKMLVLCFLLVLVVAPLAMAQPAKSADVFKSFEQRAEKFKNVVSLPHFETTTNEIRATVKQTLADGNAALDKIAALAPGKVTFENTVRALDDCNYLISLTDNRLSVIKETSKDK